VFRPIIVIAMVAAVAALIATYSSSASDNPTLAAVQQTYQGKTIIQWHKVAVRRRVDRDYLQRRLGTRVRQLRSLQRYVRHKQPYSVAYAIHLAATVYGVSESDMNHVASCESGHDPTAVNGQYRSVFQEGPMFERGPYGRAGFSVWDPIANALTAAETVSREGWSQWQCKP
jgi:hypothetical protein